MMHLTNLPLDVATALRRVWENRFPVHKEQETPPHLQDLLSRLEKAEKAQHERR